MRSVSEEDSVLDYRLLISVWAAYHKNNKSSAVTEMAAQCCTSRIFAVKLGYLSFTHRVIVIAENIAINHVLSKNRFFGLRFCHRQYES